MKTGNLRTKVITTGSGTNVRNTSQLKGEAKRSSAERESNSVTQYTCSGSNKPSPLGGRDHKN